MKHLKYLNAVLTVIAVCLVLITLAVTGVLPTANANDMGNRHVTVPVNADGSITVRLSGSPIAVDITRINGNDIVRKELPVNLSRIEDEDIGYRTLPVNIKEVDGRTIRSNPLPVVTGK